MCLKCKGTLEGATCLYVPRIADDLICALYRRKKEIGRPITKILDDILRKDDGLKKHILKDDPYLRERGF